MNYTIKNENVEACNETDKCSFPKYTSQLINWANQNAHATRPAAVGQMSELFPEFTASGEEITIDNWRSWYQKRYPDTFDTAADKIYAQIENLRSAIRLIDRKMVDDWVQDLIINKTFNGLYVQKAILSSLSELKGTDYRLAAPDEEAAGIDGYVGDTPYSVKPDSYKTMGRLSENIDVKMIYYTKTKTGLKIEVEE